MDRPEEPRKEYRRLPDWLKKNKDLETLRPMKMSLRSSRLSTVCEEARCPNICECFHKRRATFLILGDRCTRRCTFCSVQKGVPAPLDRDEPVKIAHTVRTLGLKHAVITSVTRDDLFDKGAFGFASTIREVRSFNPGCTIEALCPDFSGRQDLLEVVLHEKPDVFGHNVETIPRLYPSIRPGSDLRRSLKLLRYVKDASPDTIVKSGFMVGLGEDESEIEDLLIRLRDTRCDAVTIGQYMRPTRGQTPVLRYWEPERFTAWSIVAKAVGIRYVVAGPLVRSSYHAEEVLDEIRALR